MDGLTAEAERLFVRLIMKADDYGRFHGDARLVKAACFPLADDVTAAQIAPWIAELGSRGLLVEYLAEGRPVLAIVNYGQRLRTSRAKFPTMPGESGEWLPTFGTFQPLPDENPRVADNCPRLPATSSNPPPEGKGSGREVEYETEAEGDERKDAPDGASSGPVPKVVIGWNEVDGFTGITADDMGRWASAYPALNLQRQIAAASEWLRANPAKRKKQHLRFLTMWFSRSQEKGGDIASNRPIQQKFSGMPEKLEMPDG